MASGVFARVSRIERFLPSTLPILSLALATPTGPQAPWGSTPLGSWLLGPWNVRLGSAVPSSSASASRPGERVGWPLVVVGGNIQPLRSASRRTPGEEAATPGPKQEGGASSKEHEMGGLVPAPTPRIFGGWEPPIQDRSAPGPQCSGLQEFQNALGPRREAKAALAATPCCAHSAVTHSALHPSQPLALTHPFHHCFLGSKWFPPWPHPHLSGAQGRAGT